MTDPPVTIARCARPGMPVPELPGGGCMRDSGAHPRAARHHAHVAVPARRPALPGDGPLLTGRIPARAGPWPGAGHQAAPGHSTDDLTRPAECRLDACGPGRQASPPRQPASGPAASTPGNGEAAPSVTAWDHPAPRPADLPLPQYRAARQRPARLGAFSCLSPWPGIACSSRSPQRHPWPCGWCRGRT
jgi:hypothetical protein